MARGSKRINTSDADATLDGSARLASFFMFVAVLTVIIGTVLVLWLTYEYYNVGTFGTLTLHRSISSTILFFVYLEFSVLMGAALSALCSYVLRLMRIIADNTDGPGPARGPSLGTGPSATASAGVHYEATPAPAGPVGPFGAAAASAAPGSLRASTSEPATGSPSAASPSTTVNAVVSGGVVEVNCPHCGAACKANAGNKVEICVKCRNRIIAANCSVCSSSQLMGSFDDPCPNCGAKWWHGLHQVTFAELAK